MSDSCELSIVKGRVSPMIMMVGTGVISDGELLCANNNENMCIYDDKCLMVMGIDIVMG